MGLAYIDNTRAWWSRSGTRREILVTNPAEGGGVHWEFRISFHDLDDGEDYAKVGLFVDAWKAFADPTIQAVLAELATLAGGRPGIAEIGALLGRHGIVDATPSELPSWAKEAAKRV